MILFEKKILITKFLCGSTFSSKMYLSIKKTGYYLHSKLLEITFIYRKTRESPDIEVHKNPEEKLRDGNITPKQYNTFLTF